MKKHLLTILTVLLCNLTASAYKFEVDGIYYNEIMPYYPAEAQVTYRGDSYIEYSNEYTGAVTIPATVTHLGVTYRVTSIGDEAFRDCRKLTTITIPKSVTSIGESAFSGCWGLTTITIRENSKLTSIGRGAFHKCSSLTSITIPEGVTSIGTIAFYNCSSLTDITLPESVTSIGDNTFYDCSSLTSITIPESVTSIGWDAFYGCSSLIAVHISSIEAWCNIDFGDSYANPLSYAKNLYIDGELVTELAIPNSVTAIKDDTFSGCSSLTAITIPEGVTSIGDWAFHSCTNLTSITIPEGVTSIGSKAFYGCSSLTSINIPESVTSIGDNTFYDCSSLTSITIPESVTSIGSEAFYGCSRLTSINIPKSVTSIGDGAFSGCDLNYLVVHATNLNIEKGSSVKVAKLLVPEAALDFYQNSNWKNYCQSIESIEANLTYAFISNPSFEGGTYNCNNGTGNGDLNAPGGWQVTYTKADWGWKNFRPVSDGKGQDGNQYFEFWADTYRTLDLSQKLHSLPPGKYVLSAAMRTEQAEQVTNQHIYAKVGDITYTSSTLSAPIGSAWDAVDAWQTLSVEFTLDKAGSIVIGATSTGGAGSKGWFQIDNFQLGFSVSNISLNQTSVAIDKGETLTLTATVSPDNAINKTLTWTSSNSAVATVDSNGKVTGVGPGTAIITAKAGSRIATCVVTVEEKTIAVSNITLSQGVATLVEGEALTLIATVNPYNATNRTVTWSSGNNTVAQVDQNGRVTAMSAGVATITATADGRTATCVVTVEEKQPEGGDNGGNEDDDEPSIPEGDITDLIANPSFEGGYYNCDNGTGHGNLNAPEDWQVTYTNADWGWKNFRPVFDDMGQHGNQYFEFWGDIYHTLDLSQELQGLPAGTYTLSAAMRTERADQVTNQHIYVKVNGKEIPSAVLEAPKGSAWNAVDAWQTLTVIFTLDAESDVVIGATSTGGAGSAGWFQIDNFRLDYSKYGEYYLYHAESKRFLARGEHWGACATVDRYGIPFVWTAEEYSLKFIDSNVHLFETDDSNIYTDNASTGFAFEEVESGYLLKSQKSSRYLTIVDAAFTHDIVNVTNDASAAVVWQLKSKAEHDAIVAGYVEENYMNVIKAAGLTTTVGNFASYLATLNAEDKTSAIGTARFAGSAGDWTFTEVRHQDWQPAYGADFCELWQATGSYTQTITGLAEGIYKVTVQGFERSGWWDVCVALGEKGYEITTATLSANGEEVNLKSWLSGKTDENNPDNTGQAIAKFNEGKYMNEVYTYVGADGTLTLTVCKPSHVGGNWIVFNNFTLTRYADGEETGVEKTTDNSQQSTVIYDLTGRRVEKTVKGIYIVDGKKILVK